MADVRLVVQEFTRAGTGLVPTYKSDLTTDTYFVPNDGRTVVHFLNTGGSNSVVTVVTPNTSDGLAVTDPTYTVALTSGNKFIGPFPPNTYNVATTGEFSFTLTNPEDVSCAVFRMPL